MSTRSWQHTFLALTCFWRPVTQEGAGQQDGADEGSKKRKREDKKPLSIVIHSKNSLALNLGRKLARVLASDSNKNLFCMNKNANEPSRVREVEITGRGEARPVMEGDHARARPPHKLMKRRTPTTSPHISLVSLFPLQFLALVCCLKGGE